MRRTTWTVALAVLAAGAWASGAAAQNLVSNGDFDANTNGWTRLVGSAMTWNATDEAGCTGSGSADVTAANTGATFDAALSQCVPLSGGGTLSARVRYRQPGTLTLRFDFSSLANCAGGQLTTVSATAPASPATFSDAVINNAAVPGNAQAVLVTISASHSAPYHLLTDQVLVSRRRPLFFDNFQGDVSGEHHPCRWSTTTF